MKKMRRVFVGIVFFLFLCGLITSFGPVKAQTQQICDKCELQGHVVLCNDFIVESQGTPKGNCMMVRLRTFHSNPEFPDIPDGTTCTENAYFLCSSFADQQNVGCPVTSGCGGG